MALPLVQQVLQQSNQNSPLQHLPARVQLKVKHVNAEAHNLRHQYPKELHPAREKTYGTLQPRLHLLPQLHLTTTLHD